MSSGGVGILPVAAIVALPVAVAAGAVAAAYLTIQACGAATEVVARRVVRLGEELERAGQAQESAALAEGLWQLAAADVVALNADIRLLTQRAQQVGTHVTLPTPLRLEGCPVADLHQLLVEKDKALAVARREVERATLASEQARLAASLPKPAAGQPSLAQVLAAHQTALLRRHGDGAPVQASGVDVAAQIQAEVDQILGRLDVDATASERAEILRAAANVTGQTSIPDARTYLVALQRRIEREINPRVARRRLAATWLETLENPVVVGAIAATDPVPPLLTSAARELMAVVRGEADLTAALRTDVARALDWAKAATHRRYVRDLVRDCLLAQGYTVEGEFDVAHSAGFRAARAEWRGEHSADVWVDESGAVQGRLVRDIDASGDDADRREHARCEDFGDDLLRLADQLHARGVADVAAFSDPHYTPQRRHAQGAGVADAAVRQPDQRTRQPTDRKERP